MTVSLCQAWGEVWEIPFHATDRRRGDKFRKLAASSPDSVRDVFGTVSDISDILANTSDLERKYGIVLKRKDPVCYPNASRGMIRDQGFQALRDLGAKNLFLSRTNATENDISARQTHMSIVQRCHFQLKGEAQFERLVSRLIEFVNALWKICSEAKAEVIQFSAGSFREIVCF